MRFSKGPAAALSLSIVLGVSGPAPAYQRPGRLTTVTLTPEGAPGTGPELWSGRSSSGNTDLTSDGRIVAFDSRMFDLVADDLNSASDVFVRDLGTGTTEMISVTPDGEPGNGDSHAPAISADGRYVAFDSDASNLVPGDGNSFVDVFVRDRETGDTERVSLTSAGEQLDRGAHNPRISADGRYVAFASDSTNLGPKTSTVCDEIYVYDRKTRETERVSVTPDGGTSHGACTYGSTVDISADGRYVAFETQMHDLVPNDLNASWDIFVFDRQTRSTERVSVGSDGREANYVSYNPRISADGRFVAFSSCASNLVPEDNNSSGPKATSVLGSNNCFDIFVHDRATDVTERISVSSTGREADYASSWMDISGDGRYVAFGSDASTLHPGAPEYGSRTYVHDRATRQTEVVTVDDAGSVFAGVGFFTRPSISPDGRYVAFSATNGGKIWVRDRGPAMGVGELTVTVTGGSAAAGGWAALSGVAMTQASDPANDVTPPETARLGAELTGAALIYRPEEKDILARLSLESLPSSSSSAAATNYVLPGLAGSPGILHTLFFTVNGQRWEIRAIRGNAEEPGYPPPLIGLWKCDPTCHETLHMTGAYGATGDEIIGRITLGNISAAAGASISQVRAISAIGDALTDGLVVLDEVQLPNATIPATELRLGIAPTGSPESQVPFQAPIPMVNGAFSRTFSIAGLAPGTYDLWARACVGMVCGATATPFIR